MDAETDGAEDRHLGTAHCIQPAVSIALVLPQPAPLSQGHLHAQVCKTNSGDNSFFFWFFFNEHKKIPEIQTFNYLDSVF